MWILESKKGIFTSSRIMSNELIEHSFLKMKDLLQNSTINNESAFYEVFVPFLKNLIALVNFQGDKVYLDEALHILSAVKEKCTWIDSQSINTIIGEIKAFRSCSKKNANRRKESAIKSIQKCLKSLVKKTGVANKIHSFMNDYNRIVYSPAFRRLQDKTQVFPLEKHDYARTRLTHSVEVSSIAAQLGNITLIKLFGDDNNHTKKDIAFQAEKILSCAALLHDIGNPPFGHFGEDAIKDYFLKNFDKLKIPSYPKNLDKDLSLELSEEDLLSKSGKDPLYSRLKTDFTLFDGNAQSFRIAVKTQIYKPNHPLELTASVLGAIVKYPFSSDYASKEWRKAKFGYFYSEEQEFHILQKMLVTETNVRNPLVLLLEAADDISYVTSDLDDAIKKKILTYEMFHRELLLIDKNDPVLNLFKDNFKKYYSENKNLSQSDAFELTMQRMINDLRIQLVGETSEAFINQIKAIKNGVNVVETNSFKNFLMPNNLIDRKKNCYELLSCINSSSLVKWIRDLFPKYIYNDRSILKNELMGYEIITYLLNEFVDAVLKLEFHNGEVTKRSSLKYAKQNRVFQLISPNFVSTFKKEISTLNNSTDLLHIYYRLRLVIDYISGMTDSYAKEVYETLKGIK